MLRWLCSPLLFFTLLAACSAAPTPTPTPTLPPSPSPIPTDIDAFCPLPANWVTYLTQPGDTLRSLAARTSTTVNALALANCLNNPHGILLSGHVFYLPHRPITP
jgi:hypothetical protein